MNRQYSVEMLQISAHRMLDAMFSLQFQYVEHARRSLSTVGGDTQWPINPPHYCPPLIHLHFPRGTV